MSNNELNQDNGDLPLDLENMPSMDALLGEKSNESAIRHSNPVKSAPKNDTQENVGFLAVNTNDMPTMDKLLSSDCCLETAYEKKESSIEGKVLCERQKSKSELSRSTVINHIGNMRFVIDGSNVCRSYQCLNGLSSLAPLLTLTLTLVKHRAQFRCVFDANERYVLGKNSAEPGSCLIYENLLRSLPQFFVEVPGATDADDYILSTADRDQLPIISNDRYNKLDEHHQNQYPWLQFNTKRILKGAVNDDCLVIEQLEINTPLNYNLNQIFDELSDRLRRR